MWFVVEGMIINDILMGVFCNMVVYLQGIGYE